MKLLIAILFLIPSTAAFPQVDDVWMKLKNKFPEDPAVFVEHSEVLNISVDGDSLRVFSDVLEDILHLKEQSEIFSGRKVYGSHFKEVENIKAKTLVWEKNRYKEIEVSNFKRKNDQSAGIFYDDSYYYAFDFPSVAAQNRTQLQYRENQKDPRFISGFVFTSYLPQAKTSFTINTSKDVELVYKIFNDPKNIIGFSKSEKGKTITYNWTAENVPAFANEEQSPSIRYYAPHVICYVKSYKTKTKQIKLLGGVDELYNWYFDFVKDINQYNSSELIQVVEKIKSVSPTELDIVKNVFYWVQNNIRYVAFEQGMRGFIPNDGSYTCEKRYGDCKDMANIIVNMLSIAEVDAYHTWIGTRELPYTYKDVPTPIVDNHMIATYTSKDGRYYFLDATSNYTPFGFPSSMIQGKEALIGKGKGVYEIHTVPVIPKEQNLITDSIQIRLQNNAITGSGKKVLTGYSKVFAGYELDRVEQDNVKRYITRLVGKGNNKFFLDTYTVSDVHNHDQPVTIAYDFRINDYFQKVGEEVYINLNLNKDFYNNFINTTTRKNPRENEYNYVKREYTAFEIPEGFDVEYLPENAKYEGALMGFSISYSVKNNVIHLTKELYVNYLLMQPSQFSSWNESVKLLSEAYKEAIILKRK